MWDDDLGWDSFIVMRDSDVLGKDVKWYMYDFFFMFV